MTHAEEVLEALLPPRRKIVFASIGERVRWEDGDCGMVTNVDSFRGEYTIRWDKGTYSVHMYRGNHTLPWTYEDRMAW